MSVERFTESDRVLHILAAAHRRMDALGYPPANRPIDDRKTERTYSGPQATEMRMSA